MWSTRCVHAYTIGLGSASLLGMLQFYLRLLEGCAKGLEFLEVLIGVRNRFGRR